MMVTFSTSVAADDISDETREDYDELLIERNARGAIWLHFAVRESGNRRKLRFISIKAIRASISIIYILHIFHL